MKLDGKTTYAQSSDIKSRTYLQYRKDMKKKAIAELEVLPWLQKTLQKELNQKNLIVRKSGGDAFLWFLRRGGITREADFELIYPDNKKEFIEFQYADKGGLDYYDFKVSKVAKKKGGERIPHEGMRFIYIIKPKQEYAIFDAKWIYENGEYGMVPAWRSYAFRVRSDVFEEIFKHDESLREIIEAIDKKNYILDFQHKLIEITENELSESLQRVVDEEELLTIAPKILDGFFKVCFILSHLDKTPKNVNLWLIYVLSYIRKGIKCEDIFKITYSIDFLYGKTQLQDNEIETLIPRLIQLLEIINEHYQKDGSYQSDKSISPLEETRYCLFSINLLEDLIQDIIHYYGDTKVKELKKLKPITRIYQNIIDIYETHFPQILHHT